MTNPIITIIGGGSFLWSRFLAPDLLLHTPFENGTIVLYDLNPVNLQKAAKLYEMYRTIAEPQGKKWTIQTSANLNKAVTDADFVIVTINHGGLAGTKIDLEIPAGFGIPQTVGDTVGPGGLSRALRNVPAMIEIAEAVKEYSKKTVVLLNLSNPMTLMCMAAAKIIESRVVGYCHEWVFLREHLRKKFPELRAGELLPVIFGLNHFSAISDILQIRAGQKTSVFDTLLCATDRIPEPELTDLDYAAMNPFVNQRNVTAWMFDNWKVLPIAGDRHLIEFMIGDWLEKEMLRKFGVKITTYEDRVRGAEALAAEYEQLLSGAKPLPIEHSPEKMAEIITALAGRGDYTTNLIVAGEYFRTLYNCPFFSPDCFYEITCEIGTTEEGRPRVAPIEMTLKLLPKWLKSREFTYYTRLHTILCKMVFDGIIYSDRNLLESVLGIDPLTAQWITRETNIRQLVKQLIAKNREISPNEYLDKL